MASVYSDTCLGRGEKTSAKNTCSVILSIVFLAMFFIGPVVMSFVQWGHVDTMERKLEDLDCSMPTGLSEMDEKHCAYETCKNAIGQVAASDFTYFSRWNGGVMGFSWLASGIMYFFFVWFLVKDSATREYLDQHKNDAAQKPGENHEALAERHSEKSTMSFRKLFMYVFTARSAEVFPWTVLYCSSLLLSLVISFTMNYTFLWLMFNAATASVGSAICVVDPVEAGDMIGAADGIAALKILFVKIFFFLLAFFSVLVYVSIAAFWVSYDPLHVEPNVNSGVYTPVAQAEVFTGSTQTEMEYGSAVKRTGGSSAHHLLQSRHA